jgi:hypothetical protein
MTKTLLASAAMMFLLTAATYATAPTNGGLDVFKAGIERTDMEAKRRKPRVPGGSGCDDPGDIAEHPECTPPAKKRARKV